MNKKKMLKAQQQIYNMDIDSNSKSLAMLLTVKANQDGGDNEFFLSDPQINKLLGLGEKSKNIVINARKVLVEKGFIDYTRGHSGKKSTYKVNWDNIINIKY